MRLTGISETAARAARATGANAAERVTSPAAATSVKGETATVAATTVSGSDRSPPVDNERVAEIRKAIKEDRYPLVPTQIADALIAAKLFGIVAE